jgi:NAD(P)-dependent dehydrogenase (short-subunit alcohol dehydrogenase family)
MSKIAVVTGANQGLGLALVRGLCRTLGTDGIVYLTARDRRRGEQAISELEAEGLSPRPELLDVRADASVKALADTIAQRHGGVDIVISNAGEAAQRDILVNAACPGLVDTDASRPWFDDMSTAQSPDEAATDVLWLATLPAGTREPYGELVRHREILSFTPTS